MASTTKQAEAAVPAEGAAPSDREILADRQPRSRQERFEALESAARSGTLGTEWRDAAADLDAAQQRSDTLAAELLAEAHADRENRQQAVRKAHLEGRRLPPLQVRRMAAPHDRTLSVGRDGRGLLTPGYIGRWVRNRSVDGREDDSRISELLAVGFRFVRDRETGKIREDAIGVLMEISPEDHARWRMEHLLPVSQPAAEKRVTQAAEQINAAGRTGRSGSGRQVLTAFVPEQGQTQAAAEARDA